MITQRKWQVLRAAMEKLGIQEHDLVEKFIIGTGRGGQKLHKSASCVYLKHSPSGIEVKCQESRLRDDNRYFARKRLCEKLDEIQNQALSAKQQAIEKIRRQKRKRSKRAKEKILEEKSKRSEVKQNRKTPDV